MKNNFQKLAIISAQVFAEQLRNRFFHIFIIFAGTLLCASLALGAMAVEGGARALTDFGLGLISLAGVAAMVFGCSGAILKDMENKTVYLALSRPVPRRVYLAGKYLGFCLAVGAAMALMALVHSALLLSKGAFPGAVYWQLLASAWLKTVVIGALAIFVSLVSTSAFSAISICAFAWALGHYLAEARFLAGRLAGAAGIFLKPLLFAVPDMNYLNLAERLNSVPPQPALWPGMILYSALYCGACLIFASLIFEKKEF